MLGFSKKDALSVKKVGTAFLLLCTVLTYAPAVGATDVAAGLKAITPQIDPSANKQPEVRRPLQAGLSVTASPDKPKMKALKAGTDAGGGALKAGLKNEGWFGKLRGGAKTANTQPLKTNAQNNAFNVAATSGVGIIGVKFVLSPGKPPIINRVFPGTPAMVVGMQKDDHIVAVDGVPTFGLSKEEVYDLIIGSPGTKVNVSIMHAGDFRVVNCTRMDINDLTDPVVRRDYLMSM